LRLRVYVVAHKTLKAAMLAVIHFKSSSESGTPGTETVKIGPRSQFDEKT